MLIPFWVLDLTYCENNSLRKGNNETTSTLENTKDALKTMPNNFHLNNMMHLKLETITHQSLDQVHGNKNARS